MVIDEALLRGLAGPAAFERGLGYYHDGRVQLSRRSANGFEGRAQGTASYRLWLRQEGEDLAWDCSCPAADGGAFCKHLVAATLVWLNDDETQPTDESEDALLQALRREPRDRLACWLFEAAMDDPALANRLRLLLSTDDPKQLKKALGAMLNSGGFLDYRRSLEYGARLQTPLAILTDLLERDPEQCLALTEYAVSRLLGIYTRTDDSAGTIGAAVQAFADLHARAVAAERPSETKLAATLFKWKAKDDWGLFPLSAYWDSLGEKGRRAYARRVDKEYAKLPAQAAPHSDTERWLDEHSIVRRREELARVEGDFETLIAVLGRDLSSGYAYQQIVHACRDHGRDALAMAWAERGLKAHLNWPGMRGLVAEEYVRAGLDDEARELLWQELLERPGVGPWRRLREAAADAWPALRETALAELAVHERNTADGRRDASLRVSLLCEEGDYEAARKLAKAHAVHPDLLLALSRNLAQTQPANAGAFVRRAVDFDLIRADAKTYARIVPWIVRALELDPADETRQWLATIRDRYQARRKLMRLMDEAGLE